MEKENNVIQPIVEIFDTALCSVRQPVVILDNQFQVLRANASFYQTFDIKPKDA
jgi:PAS domain-containing protein